MEGGENLLDKLKAKFRFDLTKTEDKLKLALIVSGVTLFLLVATTALLASTNLPGFCSLCHKTMSPEFYTWKVTAHNKIACTKCHVKPGIINMLEHKVKTLKEPVLYVTGKWEKPIKMTETIEMETCLQCHSENRQFSVSGDIIIPHDRHAKKGILCTACHAGVAHAKISERGLISEDAEVQPEDWNEEYARAVVKREFTNPDMNVCMSCHKERKITLKCSACHSKLPTPLDHKIGDWGSNHGINARNNIAYCNKCHKYGLDVEKPDMSVIVNYISQNSFCSGCHKEMPKNHENDWRTNHGPMANKNGKDNCFACHRVKEIAKPIIAKVYCNQCHGW